MHALILAAVTKLIAVHLLSKTTGGGVATAQAKRALKSDPVTLVLAVEATVDGKPVVYAGADLVDFGSGKRAALPWPAELPLAVAWFKVEPTAAVADNDKGGFHWDPIPYAETPWPAAEGEPLLARVADVHPTVFPDRGGLGTMTYKATVTAAGASLSTPGRESIWRGGLTDKVARVSYRRDDTFLGYLTELYNTPYIWGSEGKGPLHQADRQIGSDCADFICYGLRRAGKKIEYGFTGNVPEWGGRKPVARIASLGADGRYLDAKGHTIAVGEGGIRPGDLLLFHRHVGAFYQEREPLGVLNQNDIIIHTAWAPPGEASLEEAKDWTQPPFEIYRVP